MKNDPPSAWAESTAKAVVLIRILIGWVFLSEGIQKFLFPDTRGAGRFVRSGFPGRMQRLRLSVRWKSCAGRRCWSAS